LGSNFKLIGGNYRVGKGKYLVIESDEFDRSFHSFFVDFGAILNIEEDHLDYFTGGIKEIKEAFKQYIEKNFKERAVLVYNSDDQNISEIVKGLVRKDLKLVSFGIAGEYKLDEIKFKLKIPGVHNRMNALAAFALAKTLGIKDEIITAALEKFEGAERRFDFQGSKNGIDVYDDYAHHPTEIRATIAAAREKYPKSRLIIVFQPHQYSRTTFFAAGFAQSFKGADIVIIPPIFAVPGRDEMEKISNLKLSKMVEENGVTSTAVNSFTDAVNRITELARSGDVVLVIGAGPVNDVSKKFLRK
jgi:UDP-N-acetylmuramate--alanine ligase